MMERKPKNWQDVSLLEIALINASLVDPRKAEYREMILIAPDHIESGSGRIAGKATAAEQSAISGKYLAKKKSVIYSKIRPYLMKAAIVYEDVLCSADMYPIECTEQIIPEYLLNVLLSERFTVFAKSCSNRTGIPKINREELAQYKLALPPLTEQTAIAALLSTGDIAIEKTEKLIEAKEKRKRALAHKLLFGKARTGKRKTAGLLEKPWFSVPDDWRIVKIGSVAGEVSLKNQNGNNIPVLSCTKYQGLVDSLQYFGKQIFSKDTSTYKVVEFGHFAYATNHIEEGSIGYQNIYPKGLVSPMYTVFKTDQKQVNDGYLFKLLKTETFRHIFEINTSASVDRRGSLRWTEFSKLPVPLPTIAEQTEINEVLDTVQQEIDLLKKQADAYRKQKRGLMQKLLTGEWRVKVD